VLADLKPHLIDNFGIFGIIKETGVDDEGLIDFAKNYFPFPVYCDKSYAFYQALGDRKVGLKDILNPLSLLGIACDAFKRLREKSIGGNAKGEGIVQGGYIVFGADGYPRCMYEEQTGVDLPVVDLVNALEIFGKL